jgi:hypothetical protein
MTHILHLGHQATDIAGISGLISTAAGGFDDTLDVNAIRFSGTRSLVSPFSASFRAPAGDLWLGFRYVAPSADAASIADPRCRQPDVQEQGRLRGRSPLSLGPMA